MELYIALVIPILLITAWLYTAEMTRTTLPTFHNKRICLLIAHPDDEAMFFAPTLSALTAPQLGNHVKILCLSSGNADGLGEIRKRELGASAKMLGLRAEKDVLVLEDEAFPDSMSVMWEKEKVIGVLSSAFVPRSKHGKGSGPLGTTIDVLITFDGKGVSGHPNHRSLYHGAKAWLGSLMVGNAGWKPPCELYTLSSVGIVRKYVSFLDGPLTLFLGAKRGVGMTKRAKRESPPSMVFISSFGDYRRGQLAMTKGHRSQMRWFRWGWIAAGRYMVVNDLKRESMS